MWLVIWVVLSFIVTILIFKNSYIKSNAEPPFPFKNVIVVIDSDAQENKCIHVHHWFWLSLLLFIIIGLNYMLGHKWCKLYTCLFWIIIGTTLAEWVLFKNNIFVFTVKCFNKCPNKLPMSSMSN